MDETSIDESKILDRLVICDLDRLNGRPLKPFEDNPPVPVGYDA